jgi:hypothetical protein
MTEKLTYRRADGDTFIANWHTENEWSKETTDRSCFALDDSVTKVIEEKWVLVATREITLGGAETCPECQDWDWDKKISCKACLGTERVLYTDPPWKTV